MIAFLKGMPVMGRDELYPIFKDKFVVSINYFIKKGIIQGTPIIVSDDPWENDIDKGGTINYSEMIRGVSCTLFRAGGLEWYPDYITFEEAIENLKKYLNEGGHTGWDITIQ